MSDTVPDGWMERPLSELLDSLESGSRPKGGVRGIAKGVPSIGGEHLSYSGKFDFSNIKYVPEAFAEKMKRGRIQLNDILIVKDGATTGKTSFVDQYFPFQKAVVNEHVFICRPSREANAKYLFWFLFGKEGQDRILENFKGSAQGGINTTFAPNTLVPVAPLLEQERIVHQLDTLMAKLDSARDRLDKVPKILRRFRRAVLSVAMRGELTNDWRLKNNETLSSWKKVVLGQIAEIRLGKMLDEVKNQGQPTRYLRNINVRWFSFDLTSLMFIRVSSDEKRTLALRNGDVLVCEGGEPGRSAVWTDGETDIIFQKALHRVRPHDCLDSKWLAFKIKCDADSGELSDYFTGTTIKHLTGKSFKKYELSLPSKQEQQEIVHRVEKLFAVADQIEERYRKAKAFTDKLPQSILKKAFQGELNQENEKTEKST